MGHGFAGTAVSQVLRGGADADLELDELKERSAHRPAAVGPEDEDADLDGDVAARVELRTAATGSKAKALLWKNFMWVWRHRM